LKRDIYEGGHRLPFLVKWPGVVPPDSVCSALVSQIDLMATLAAVVGAKLPTNAAEDSHDLLPLFKGDKAPVRETHVHNTFANTYAIRHGDWVLVDAKTGYGEKIDPKWDTRHGYPAEDSQPAELYNIKEDIGQKNNLAAAHPEKVEELRTLLKKSNNKATPHRAFRPVHRLRKSPIGKWTVIDNGPGGYEHQCVEPYWRDFSPLNNIPANPPPTLFITGDKDAYIPIDTARKFQAEIQRQGGRWDLVALEGGRHGSPFEGQYFPRTLQAMDAFSKASGI